MSFKRDSRNTIVGACRAVGLKVTLTPDKIEVDSSNWHTAAWLLKFQPTNGYWSVYPWNEFPFDYVGVNSSDGGEWGRAICSIRNMTQVVKFCDSVVTLYELRARRKD